MFSPWAVEVLMKREREWTQDGLMCLAEKWIEYIKGRYIFNGKPTKEWLDKKDLTSPIVGLDRFFNSNIRHKRTMRCDDGRHTEYLHTYCTTTESRRRKGNYENYRSDSEFGCWREPEYICIVCSSREQ